MGGIIDGRLIAKQLREDIKSYVDNRISRGLRTPCLATVIVGEDGGSLSYVKNQKKLCDELGIENRHINLMEDISEEELVSIIKQLNDDRSIDGIIVQLPLPKHLDEKLITSKIDYKKDVDGLTDVNMGKFYKGEKCFVPCTPQSALQLVKSTGINIEGKNAVVIGRSNIVGKPVAQLLLQENATITICHSKTQDLEEVCKRADILVCAIGKPGFITRKFVKQGAVVIDVGTSMAGGKLQGDVYFEDVIETASFLTPVPGGVGALTTTILLKNTCEAMENNVH